MIGASGTATKVLSDMRRERDDNWRTRQPLHEKAPWPRRAAPACLFGLMLESSPIFGLIADAWFGT